MIIVEEHRTRWRFLPFQRGGGGTIEEVNVQPAVVVVIEEADAGAGSVKDSGFFGRAGTMAKLVEAGLFGDFEENDGSAVHEATGSDGTRLRILHWSVRAAGGHAGGSHRSGRLRRLRIRWRGLLFECCRGEK